MKKISSRIFFQFQTYIRSKCPILGSFHPNPSALDHLQMKSVVSNLRNLKAEDSLSLIPNLWIILISSLQVCQSKIWNLLKYSRMKEASYALGWTRSAYQQQKIRQLDFYFKGYLCNRKAKSVKLATFQTTTITTPSYSYLHKYQRLGKQS